MNDTKRGMNQSVTKHIFSAKIGRVEAILAASTATGSLGGARLMISWCEQPLGDDLLQKRPSNINLLGVRQNSNFAHARVPLMYILCFPSGDR